MSRWLPHLLLGLLLLAAGMVWAAGWHGSARTEMQRVPRDRSELVQAAQALQKKLTQLEDLYTSHLKKLATSIQPEQDIPNKRACENVVGVVRCSILNPEVFGRIDRHIDIVLAAAPPLRRPALWKRVKAEDVLLLTEDEVYATLTGWIDSQTHPHCFIHVLPSGVVVALTVDTTTALQAIATGLREDFKLPQPFACDRVVSPSKEEVTTTMKAPPERESADFVQPVTTRFGLWQIESWDERQPVTVIDQRLRSGSTAAAVALACIGLVMSWQQSRALRRAQQRVSFVNSVSHELRTPLTNMLLNLDLAAEELPAHPRLDHVRQEAGRLGRLIENVLTFSRAEQGKLQLRPQASDVSTLIRDLVKTFEPLFQRRGITLATTLALPPALTLDADALTQILSNLLSNIEKYAPQASASLEATVEQSHLRITITDNGPGIPSADAQRIFEPFVRLSNNVNEGVSGTGLGLAIARDLAQRMGGTLQLLPSERGSIFRVSVPIDSSSA